MPKICGRESLKNIYQVTLRCFTKLQNQQKVTQISFPQRKILNYIWRVLTEYYEGLQNMLKYL